ncbi:MAG: hypothetical protein HQ573_07455 [Desulfobacteraceae bacterium]|nr:hypothetical protein [Desulfobacteraceae bacterium]
MNSVIDNPDSNCEDTDTKAPLSQTDSDSRHELMVQLFSRYARGGTKIAGIRTHGAGRNTLGISRIKI